MNNQSIGNCDSLAKSRTVYIAESAEKIYHYDSKCGGHELELEGVEQVAIDAGYAPCKVCCAAEQPDSNAGSAQQANEVLHPCDNSLTVELNEPQQFGDASGGFKPSTRYQGRTQQNEGHFIKFVKATAIEIKYLFTTQKKAMITCTVAVFVVTEILSAVIVGMLISGNEAATNEDDSTTTQSTASAEQEDAETTDKDGKALLEKRVHYNDGTSIGVMVCIDDSGRLYGCVLPQLEGVSAEVECARYIAFIYIMSDVLNVSDFMVVETRNETMYAMFNFAAGEPVPSAFITVPSSLSANPDSDLLSDEMNYALRELGIDEDADYTWPTFAQ